MSPCSCDSSQAHFLPRANRVLRFLSPKPPSKRTPECIRIVTAATNLRLRFTVWSTRVHLPHMAARMEDIKLPSFVTKQSALLCLIAHESQGSQCHGRTLPLRQSSRYSGGRSADPQGGSYVFSCRSNSHHPRNHCHHRCNYCNRNSCCKGDF